MENYKFNKGSFIWGLVGLGTGAAVLVITKGNPRAFLNCGLGFALVVAAMTLEPRKTKD